jgi:hypothetical protein
MNNSDILKLPHGQLILDFYSWRANKANLKREKQLEDDEVEVIDYTIDTYSELKFK